MKSLFSITSYILTLYLLSTNEGICQKTIWKFEPQLLCIDNNEACDIGDINQDGLLDVVAGRLWYAAPDFVPRPVRAIALHPPDYARNNGEHLYDVNQDGYPDLVTTGWGEDRILWYQNPGEIGLQKGLPWAVHTAFDVGHGDGETGSLIDINQDGAPEYIINSYIKSKPFHIYFWNTEGIMQGHPIGDLNSHGVGFGDVNSNGRIDVLIDRGWYEQPSANALSTVWRFHADWMRPDGSCPMIIVDLNRDGRNDIISGAGHNYGLHWYEQLEREEDSTIWRRHLIDSSWSQVHTLLWEDLNNDGRAEMITGKRLKAHSGKDPGTDDPPHMYIYNWDNSTNTFSRQQITEGSIGTGLIIRSADLNQDGKIDLVVAGKTGTYILWNRS